MAAVHPSAGDVLSGLPGSLREVYRQAFLNASDAIDSTASSRSIILPLLNTLPGIITLSNEPMDFLKLLSERYLEEVKAETFNFTKSSSIFMVFVYGALRRTLIRQDAASPPGDKLLSRLARVEIAHAPQKLGPYQLLARVLQDVRESEGLEQPITLYAVADNTMTFEGTVRTEITPAEKAVVSFVPENRLEPRDKQALYSAKKRKIPIDANLSLVGAEIAESLNAGSDASVVFNPLEVATTPGGLTSVQDLIDNIARTPGQDLSAMATNSNFGKNQTVMSFSREVVKNFLMGGTTAVFAEPGHEVALIVERLEFGINVLVCDPNHSGLQVFERDVTSDYRKRTGDKSGMSGNPGGWCATFSALEVECYLCKSTLHYDLMKYARESRYFLTPQSAEAREVSNLFGGSDTDWKLSFLNLVKCLFLRNLDIVCRLIAHYDTWYADTKRLEIAHEGKWNFSPASSSLSIHATQYFDPHLAFLPKQKEDTWA